MSNFGIADKGISRINDVMQEAATGFRSLCERAQLGIYGSQGQEQRMGETNPMRRPTVSAVLMFS